ncbi:DUF4124 domain-containing protein [Undibacterium danionis]|uniref:DUF4124 domain-containing protein n=1 Tax=Undibacterium danionis TaxID=1812100 RepID=A0ABV6IAS3_9BURK
MEIHISIFFAALSFASVASAEIYKCQGADGKLKYTDRPCYKNSEQQTVVKLVVPPPSVTPFNRPSLKEQDEAFKERHKMRQDYERCLADPMSMMCFGPNEYAVRRPKK